MIKLNKEEKASRWDALQVAIHYTTETYRARRAECENKYGSYGAGTLGAYNKGLADAYGQMIETLERWGET